MAGLVRFWVCLLLVLVAGLGCKTRFLFQSPVLNKKGALMKQAQEIIKATISARVRVEYNVDRISLGGPDPKKKGALMEQAQEIIKVTISGGVRVEYNVTGLVLEGLILSIIRVIW